LDPLLEYHEATKHSPSSVQSSRFELDWPNKPLPFKIYTSLEPIALPLTFAASAMPAFSAIAGPLADNTASITLETIARLCYFANGITRVLQRQGQKMPFRAAACTGALYHIELYVVCAELTDVSAGVYHYAAHDNALRLLRQGDLRGVLAAATGEEPSVTQAPVTMVATSTFWRNAWKYQARAYRHAFWDTGTIVANLLSVANANAVSANLMLGFADGAVNELLDTDPEREAAVCLVALGHGTPPASPAPTLRRLRLPTQPLSATQVEYPEIIAAHNASSLRSAAAVRAWRSAASSPGEAIAAAEPPAWGETSAIEQVILRRGSARRFAPAPIALNQLMAMLGAATTPLLADVPSQTLTQPYVIVNAVDGLGSGAYVFHKSTSKLELLKPGNFRPQAAFLDLGQDLASQAAVNVYWLSDLHQVSERLGPRGYRAAQLAAAVEGGKLYLAAYALGLGATGLTFFDDDVSRFFDAANQSVMFLVAVGHPARRSA